MNALFSSDHVPVSVHIETFLSDAVPIDLSVLPLVHNDQSLVVLDASPLAIPDPRIFNL